MRISKIATLLIGLLAILLGIAFKSQNVAYMIALVVGIAASSNFPLLFLAIYWRGLTTRGAIAGGLSGLIGSIVLTITGPSIWVSVLGNAAPLVPLDPPTLVTMPLAFRRLRRCCPCWTAAGRAPWTGRALPNRACARWAAVWRHGGSRLTQDQRSPCLPVLAIVTRTQVRKYEST